MPDSLWLPIHVKAAILDRDKFYKWHQLSQSKEVEQIRAQAISEQLRVESIFTNKRP